MENSHSDSENKELLKISAVGDIMLGVGYPQSINDENNLLNRLKNDYESILEDVRPLLKDTDILFGNFENVIIEDFSGDIQRDPKFIATTPKALDLLEYGGFDVLNLANNHILDYGKDNAAYTENLLKKEDFTVIGSPNSTKEKLEIMRVNGVDIGFLGFNLCEQENKTEISKILEKVEKSKSEVGLLIVSLHWGWKREHMPMPSKDQVKLGHKIIDQGADIILGHHSHVFQPIELYNGGVIAYSLGNFVFDMWRLENRLGGILEISIQEDLEMSVMVKPTLIKNYRVKPAEKYFDKMENFVCEEIKNPMSNEKYQKELQKKKRQHKKEFFNHYLNNCFHLTLKVNYKYMREFFTKGLQIINPFYD